MGLNIFPNYDYKCNTISFSSNKGVKLQIIKLNKSKVANDYTNIGIVILRPSIDRITFGFTPSETFLKKHDPSQDLQEYQEAIRSWVFGDAVADEDNYLSFVKGKSFKKQPYASYNINLNFQPPGAKEPILVQVAPKKPESKKAFIRIDMKPDNLDVKAMKAFRAFIEDLLIMPGCNPSYADFLAEAVIYHLEINVDMLGVKPYDLEIVNYSNKKPVPAKSMKYKSKTGRTQTAYPNPKKSGKSDYIYDKRNERVEKNEEPIYGDILHSRFECRIQKTAFSKLAKINNRCLKVGIRSLDVKKFSKLPYTYKMFVRLALEQTLDKALELAPPNVQPKLRKVYEGVMVNIWNPKTLWDYWKAGIVKHPLLQPK